MCFFTKHDHLHIAVFKSLMWPQGSHIWLLFALIHMLSYQKCKYVKLESVRTLLTSNRITSRKSYLVIIYLPQLKLDHSEIISN